MIQAFKCYGLEVNACHFERPVPGWDNSIKNPAGQIVTFTNAVMVWGIANEGRLRLIDNVCTFKSTPNVEAPDDDAFLTCAGTSFHSIRVIGNHIKTRDDGVELLFNAFAQDASFPFDMLIHDNTINIHQTIGTIEDRWPLHVGITSCLNGPAGTGSTQIVRNTVFASGPFVSALVLSGEHFVVRDNTLHLDTLSPVEGVPTAAILMGLDIPAGTLAPTLGPSLNDSDIFRNTIHGKAQYGFETFAPSNVSHGNVIEDNDFRDFAPWTPGGFIHVGPGNWVSGNT